MNLVSGESWSLQEETVEESASLATLLAKLFAPPLRSLTIRLWAVWLDMAFLYYGLILLTVYASKGAKEHQDACVHLNNSNYLTILVTNASEIPGLFVAFALLERIGRPKTIASMFFCTALGCFFVLIPDIPPILGLFMSRACALAFNQSLWVYTSELYPTTVRVTGLGSATAMARIGGSISPLITSFAPSVQVALLICVGSGLLGAGLTLTLPRETANQPLGDTISGQSGHYGGVDDEDRQPLVEPTV